MRFTRRGYITVYKDGEYVSRHVAETEAVESAFRNGPGKYTVTYPDKTVEVPDITEITSSYWPSDYWATDGVGTYVEVFDIELGIEPEITVTEG